MYIGVQIVAGKNIEFSFSTVGRLSIRNRKVKMRFYKEFIHSMEGSDEILNAMRDVSVCTVENSKKNLEPIVCDCQGVKLSKKTVLTPSNLERKVSSVGLGPPARLSIITLPPIGDELVKKGRVENNLSPPISPPHFSEALSPYCHGYPKFAENYRDRWKHIPPSAEDEEIVRAYYKNKKVGGATDRDVANSLQRMLTTKSASLFKPQK